MKDNLGLYYYPNPSETSVRMYVRRSFGSVEFRLHNRQHPEIWDRHGWVPYDEILKAASAYQSRGGTNPLVMYDIGVAQHLLAEDESAATTQ